MKVEYNGRIVWAARFARQLALAHLFADKESHECAALLRGAIIRSIKELKEDEAKADEDLLALLNLYYEIARVAGEEIRCGLGSFPIYVDGLVEMQIAACAALAELSDRVEVLYPSFQRALAQRLWDCAGVDKTIRSILLLKIEPVQAREFYQKVIRDLFEKFRANGYECDHLLNRVARTDDMDRHLHYAFVRAVSHVRVNNMGPAYLVLEAQARLKEVLDKV